MIKGTKAKRVTCDHAVERLLHLGFRYLYSICVPDEQLRGLEDVVIGGFYAKMHEDLFYVYYLNRKDETTSTCDVFQKEAQS